MKGSKSKSTGAYLVLTPEKTPPLGPKNYFNYFITWYGGFFIHHWSTTIVLEMEFGEKGKQFVELVLY